MKRRSPYQHGNRETKGSGNKSNVSCSADIVSNNERAATARPSVQASSYHSSDATTNSSNIVPAPGMFLNQTSYVSRRTKDGTVCGIRLGPSSQNTSVFTNNNNILRPRRRRRNQIDPRNRQDGTGINLSSLIASELTRLSLKDREKVLEEVHGVISNEDEDPGKIKILLSEVNDELKKIRSKQAYEKASFISNSYVMDMDFVLMFLRADNYIPKLAAMRIVQHFKYKLELFGESSLVRDIMYDDLTNADQSVIESGFIQSTSLYDRAGRQIMVCNMCHFLKNWNLNQMVCGKSLFLLG